MHIVWIYVTLFSIFLFNKSIFITNVAKTALRDAYYCVLYGQTPIITEAAFLI